MARRSLQVIEDIDEAIKALGLQLRERRKALGISSVTMTEAAGLSRMTLHRVERGEAGVAMGAYMSVVAALGLKLELEERKKRKQTRAENFELPQKIRIDDYKQLKRLAWQIKKNKTISAKQALDLYERNWRHVDKKAMEPEERRFLEALLAAFGRERLLV